MNNFLKIKYMQDLLRQLLIKYKLSDLEIKKIADQFSTVVILTLVGGIFDQISDSEKQELQDYAEQKKYDRILPFIKDRYSSEEFDRLLEQHVAPLLDSYLTEVVK